MPEKVQRNKWDPATQFLVRVDSQISDVVDEVKAHILSDYSNTVERIDHSVDQPGNPEYSVFIVTPVFKGQMSQHLPCKMRESVRGYLREIGQSRKAQNPT